MAVRIDAFDSPWDLASGSAAAPDRGRPSQANSKLRLHSFKPDLLCSARSIAASSLMRTHRQRFFAKFIVARSSGGKFSILYSVASIFPAFRIGLALMLKPLVKNAHIGSADRFCIHWQLMCLSNPRVLPAEH